MAHELQIAYNSDGSTLYGIIRRTSDNYVWNGTAFEVWANGSVGAYDIPLTGRGGDLYTADFPSAIVAGDYLVIYYRQATASPATTDDVLGRPIRRFWNGAALVESSDVTLSAYALATLAEVKRDLGITDSASDTILTEHINAASDFLERFSGRQFVARNYRERIDGLRQSRIRTRQFPISTMTRVAVGAAEAFSITFTGSAIRANAAVYNDYASNTSGGIRLVTVASTGVVTENNLVFTSYDSVSELVAAIDAISGWNATTITDVPSMDLNPTVLGDTLNVTQYATYPDVAMADYKVDYQTGLIEIFQRPWFESRQSMAATITDSFTSQIMGTLDFRGLRTYPPGWQGYLIEYRAGYETIPASLNRAARILVKNHYYARDHYDQLKSETLGPWSATYGSMNDQDTAREYLYGSGFIDYAGCVA